jgi:hypothetical protein
MLGVKFERPMPEAKKEAQKLIINHKAGLHQPVN